MNSSQVTMTVGTVTSQFVTNSTMINNSSMTHDDVHDEHPYHDRD